MPLALRLALVALAVSLAGCDSDGVRGPCFIGDQPALNRNDVSASWGDAPAPGDTLRLGEPFALRARLDAIGPDLTSAGFALQVVRLRRNVTPMPDDVLLAVPLDAGRGVTELDRDLTVGRLRGGVTSRDLASDETLALTLTGEITYPVESEGPGCGTVETGSAVTVYRPVVILAAAG